MLDELSIPKGWDLESDVVIIGAGTAGLSAAYEAAKAGAETLVLEQMPKCAGSLSVCAGNINFAGSAFQRKKGIEDSPDRYYEDGIKGCRGDPSMWRTFVDNHLKTYEIITDLGYEPLDVWLLPGHSIRRSHYFVGGGPELLKILERGSKGQAAKTLFNHKAMRLIVDPVRKRVVGVTVKKDRKVLNFKARKAVIIASGGFGNNPRMVEEFKGLSYAKRCLPTMRGHTGEGIKMAMAIGVATSHIGTAAIPSIPMDANTKNPAAITLHHTLCGAIFINSMGKRYVNECLQIFPYLGEAAFKQPGDYVFTIYDSEIRKLIELIDWSIFKEYEAETIEGLAKQLDIDPKALAETIREYNEDIDRFGYDTKFGKKLLLAHLNVPPVKIEKAPFYGIKLMNCFTSYKGGLKINSNAQTIDQYGDVVPGLYAAGEVAGGLFGEGYYLCGTMICMSMTFGRIAGINAAAEKS
ncbi:MAG: FAD-dependent oxidoreductase [Candidatus Hodarchaeota archaeon]